MKKVLFTATVDSHIMQFHLPYLKWFKEQGYEVHVATNGIKEIPYCDKKYTIPFERNPIKIRNLTSIKKLKKVINEENYNIIHCHTPMGGVVTRIASIKAREKGTQIIYTAHGFHFFKGASFVNWLVFYPIEKILSKYTDTIITINEEDYKLAKKRFKAKQIEFIQGVGIELEKFQNSMNGEEKSSLRKSLKLENNDFVIIYVAELSKRKNQGMLLKAIKELIDNKTDIKVLLPGIDSMNGYYQNMCKKLKIKENVRFLGYRQDIPKLLQISDLYISTAKQEGLPVNIMEAMACGLPIIATDCRGNRDLVHNCVKINNIENLKREIKNNYLNKHKVKYNLENYELKQILNQMINRIYNKGNINEIS